MESKLETKKELFPAKKGFRFTDKNLPFFLIAPVILIFLIITVFPLLYSLYTSTIDLVMTRPELGKDFVGIKNYITVIKNDLVQRSFLNTLLFTAIVVPVELLLGLGMAVLLNRELKIKRFVIPIMIIPITVTPLAVGLIWRYMYNGEYGIIAWLLKFLHVQNYVVLANPFWALPGIMLADIWHWTPFMMLLLLTGLQSLPQEPFEAARIDGSSGWTTFKNITLPMLKPVILIAVLLRTMDAFKLFDEVYIMTQGGPGTATETLAYRVFRSTFQYYDMGKGTALSILMLILIIVISKWYMRILRERQAQPEESANQ